jgi:DHHC palmitoyltransferase
MTLAVYIAGFIPSPSILPIKALMRILGPLLIILLYGLSGYCTYSYFTMVLPWYSNYIKESMLITIIGLFVLCNLLYNYTLCLLTPPGNPDQTVGPSCKKCNKSKPPRSHHCSVCNKCVLKMDHHCPWIHNCLGLRNHGYFLLFLLYLDLGCIFFTIFSFPVLISTDKNTLLITSFTICSMFSLIILGFGGWHWYLAVKGTTTIEYFDTKRPNYSKGSWKKNLQVVFGSEISLKLFLPHIIKLSYDGSNWPDTIHSI